MVPPPLTIGRASPAHARAILFMGLHRGWSRMTTVYARPEGLRLPAASFRTAFPLAASTTFPSSTRSDLARQPQSARAITPIPTHIPHQEPKTNPHRSQPQACHPWLEPWSEATGTSLARLPPDRSPGQVLTPAQGPSDSGANGNLRASLGPLASGKAVVAQQFPRVRRRRRLLLVRTTT